MKKRILCFGDSNTWGAVPGESTRHPEDIRWTGVLAKDLGSEYGVIEEGYNGRTSVHDDPVEDRLSGITYFKPCLASHYPLDLIILMLGTNDLKTRFQVNARTIAYGFGRYLNVINTASMTGDKPEVLLVSPILIHPSYKDNALFYDMLREGAVERSRELSKAYEEFANEKGIHFFDAAEYGKASIRDGIHMDVDSHERLGKALAKKTREVIRKGVNQYE